ncbi:hypothetical protein ACFQ9X_01010 [Catenulispora yoronensis]
MSIREYRPVPRRTAPPLPQGEITFQEPPAVPEAAPGGVGQALMAVPMAAGSGAMALMFLQPGARAMNYLAGGMMAVSSLGMVGMQLGAAAATSGSSSPATAATTCGTWTRTGGRCAGTSTPRSRP